MPRLIALVFAAVVLTGDYALSNSGQTAKWSSIIIGDATLFAYIVIEMVESWIRKLKEAEK